MCMTMIRKVERDYDRELRRWEIEAREAMELHPIDNIEKLR